MRLAGISVLAGQFQQQTAISETRQAEVGIDQPVTVQADVLYVDFAILMIDRPVPRRRVAARLVPANALAYALNEARHLITVAGGEHQPVGDVTVTAAKLRVCEVQLPLAIR